MQEEVKSRLVELEKRDPDKLKSLEDMLNGWLAIAPPEIPMLPLSDLRLKLLYY